MSDFLALLRLGADTSGLKKGQDELDKTAGVGEKTEARVGKSMAAIGKSLAIFAAGAISVAAAMKLVSSGAADIDAVAKAARRLDSSITGFRALEMAAGEAGVALATLTDAVQAMDREMARGGKNAADSMARLGIALKDMAGLDADQKIALLADRIKAMGMTTGEASVVLQDFGIRNREMILAVMDGGDALRAARKDVEDYGLGLSSIQSDEIEAANDAIGRLALIGQYLAQQLALAVIPALGKMAKAMTDSLREGGLLRAALDALAGTVKFVVDNFDMLMIALGALAASRITAAITGIVALVAGLDLAAISAGALAFAMNAIPFVAVVTGATLLWRAIQNQTTSTSLLDTAQGKLNETLGKFANDYSPAAKQAAIDATKAALDQAAANLAVVESELQVLNAFAGKNLDKFNQELLDDRVEKMRAEKDALLAAINALRETGAMISQGGITPAKVVDDYTTSIAAAGTATYAAIPPLSELRAQYGDSAVAARDLLQAMNVLAVADTKSALLAAATAASGMAVQFGMTAEEAALLAGNLSSIGGDSSLATQANVAQNMAAQLALAAGGAGNLEGEAREAYQRLLEAAQATRDIAAAAGRISFAAATNSAAALAAQLGISLTLARSLAGMGKGDGGKVVFDPRDPRYDPDAAAHAKKLFDTAETMKKLREETDAAAISSKGFGAAIKGAGGAAGGAAKQVDALSGAIEGLEWDADPAKKYRAELAKLDELLGQGLSVEAYQKAVQKLNDELANQVPMVNDVANAWADFVMRGFRDFNGFVKAILGSFTKMISQMIATAARNKILFSMGMIGGGAGGAQAGGAGGAGGGILNSVIGGLGGFFGSMAGGFMNTIGALFGSGGGLGAMFGSIGAQIGTAFSMGTLSSIGAAIGAIAVPLLALAAVFSFFKKKTTELDSGLRLTIDATDMLVETFRKLKVTQFWGLSKKIRFEYGDADPEIANPLRRVVRDIQKSVMQAADVLGIGAEAFDGFSHVLSISTKGMSDEQAQKAVEDALIGLGDAYASMIGELQSFTHEGEGAMAALNRLAGSVLAVNHVMDTLGHRMFAASLAGADMASNLIDLFGGLDAFNNATTAYFSGFYSEQERFDTAMRQITEHFGDLGIAMPKTRAEFRAMVEAVDTTTESGREMYAALVSMSGALDAVLPAIANLTAEMMALVGSVATGIDGMVADATEAQRASQQAASMWYRTSASLRQFIADLRGTASDLVSASAARVANEARYQALLASALAGDNQAATDLPNVAKALLVSTKATATSRVEQARAEARVLAGISLAAGVSDIEGARHDVVAGLLDQQVDLLTAVKDYLTSGGALDPEQIDDLNAQLGSLQSAIKAAEMINYAFLKERLAVTVDLLATADVPAELRTMLANAATGITAQINYIVRADGLTPDLRWLAMNAASEHIKTIEFVASDMQWPDEVKALALDAGGTYSRVVKFVAQNTMPADLTGLALSDAKELLRAIKFTAGALPADIRDLVLTDAATLQRTIDIIAGKTIPEDQKRLALEDAAVFKRMIDLVAGKVLPDGLQLLALQNPEEFTRAINFLAGERLPTDLEALALGVAGTYAKTVRFLANNLMPADLQNLAISDASTLLKSIQFAAQALPADVRAIVFNDIDALQKRIDFAVGNALPGQMVSLALDDAKEFTRIINSVAGRVLPADLQKLALDNPTAFTRSMNIIAGALPAGEVKRLALDAAATFNRTINFSVGAKLPADLQKLALDQASAFTKTVNFVRGGVLPVDLNALATGAASAYVKTIKFLATNLMSADLTKIAIGDASQLLKSIQFIAGALPNDVRKVVFNDIAALQKRINFIVGQDIPDTEKKLALADATAFKRTLDMVAGNVVTGDVRTLALAQPVAFRRALDIVAGATPTGDVKRLALDAATAFTRIINLTAGRTIDAETAAIALMASDTITRSVKAVLASGIDADAKRIALAGSSELQRVVNVSLASGADAQAIRLALGVAGNYAVAVTASLTAAAEVRKIVFGDAGAYAAMIEASFSPNITPDVRRVLLAQLGGYSVIVGASLAAGMTPAIQTLLINASTAAARAVTISAVYAQSLTADQLALLRAQAATIDKAIRGSVAFVGFDADRFAMLRAATATITKTILGVVDLGTLTAPQISLLEAIRGNASGMLTLGGSFTFDPSTGFAVWFGNTTMANIATPMATLRDSLSTLSGLIRAQEQRIAADAAKATKVTALNRLAGGFIDAGGGQYLASEAGIRQAAGIIGANPSADLDVLKQQIAGFSDTDGIKSLAQYTVAAKAFLFNNIGAQGLKVVNSAYLAARPDVLASEKFHGDAQRHWEENGKAEMLADPRWFNPRMFDWSSIGLKIPGFAAGGIHGGGPAYIAENGPELVAPSRIFNAGNTRAMLDNREVVAELKALKEELRAFKDQSRQLDMGSGHDLRKLRQIEERREIEAIA